ncbi:hypothetical protein ANN_10760 [Periplaneta americana]|uniref:Uncharacterized protein n=1 Tax=Periplaneta americana TaxID=6978 RepID=A0ABQ8T4T9_PERAM|nr:hypothetical protein ANN_10760 [Periplaneta americana]
MAANYSVVVTPVYKKTINKGCKRKINIDEWKDDTRKSLKEYGKEYTSRNSIVKRAKQPPNCETVCKCKYAGCKILNHDTKLRLFTDYYNKLKTHDEQSSFLVHQCIELCDIGRRYRVENLSHRQCSFKYFLFIRSKRVQVCLKTLLQVYAISSKRIQILQAKMKNNGPLTDQRVDTVFCPATHFALIEKQKRIAKVNVPVQWVEVIVAARPTNPFQVTYMQSEDFKNFDTLDKNVTYPKEFKITEAMWLKCSQNDPFSVYVRKSHGTLQSWVVYPFHKKQRIKVPCPSKKRRNEILHTCVSSLLILSTASSTWIYLFPTRAVVVSTEHAGASLSYPRKTQCTVVLS